MMHIHHLETLISSPRPSMMGSMTRSCCSRRGRPKAPLPLHIKATNWPPVDEIVACNDDLVVAIIEVIAGHMTPIENHLTLAEDLFGLNPK